MHPYPEILSKLLIKVLVVIFGEVVKPTLKQADDSIGGMSGNDLLDAIQSGAWPSI